MSLLETLILPTTSRYTNPEQIGVPLPLVYGDMTENTTLGAWAAPCIDTVNLVYCVAGWEIVSSPSLSVYDDDTLVSSSLYAVNTANNYESQGTIATITFSTAPEGTVTVKCKGKPGSDSALITNPIAILKDLLTYAGDQGLDIPPRDRTAWNTAQYDAEYKSYMAAGVIISDNSPAFWLTKILSDFLGDWWQKPDKTIIIRLDTDYSRPSAIAGFLWERTYLRCVGSRDIRNLVNQVPVNYAVSLADIDRRFKDNVNSSYYKYDDGSSTADLISQRKYGIRTIATRNLDWTRNTATVTAIQERIVEKFADPIWLYEVEESGLHNIQVQKGDFVGFNWKERKDESGLPLRNQICQVVDWAVNMDSHTITYKLRDTNSFFQGDPPLYDGTYTVGDGGVFGGGRDRRIFP